MLHKPTWECTMNHVMFLENDYIFTRDAQTTYLLYLPTEASTSALRGQVVTCAAA